jgi:hypothetical protein
VSPRGDGQGFLGTIITIWFAQMTIVGSLDGTVSFSLQVEGLKKRLEELFQTSFFLISQQVKDIADINH